MLSITTGILLIAMLQAVKLYINSCIYIVTVIYDKLIYFNYVAHT